MQPATTAAAAAVAVAAATIADEPIVYDERFIRALASSATFFDLIDRTDIGAHIEQYWLQGGAGAIMGTQYVTLDTAVGIVRLGTPLAEAWERKDVARLYLDAYFNVFVDADGTFEIDGSDDDARSVKECKWKHALVISRVEHELRAPAVQAHLERHRRFFAERPWRALDGLAPKQAVAKWRELGWAS